MSEMEKKENFDTDEAVEIKIEDGEEEILDEAADEAVEADEVEAAAGDENRKDDGTADAEDGETSDGGETSEKDADAAHEDPDNSGEQADDGEEEEKSGKVSKEKGRLFKKKKDKKDEKIEELTDQLKRQMAEFENFRKRSEKEKSQMFDMGAKNVIEKMLAVVDNFERGLAAVPEEQNEDSFVSGMDMIYKQILTEFDNLGVKPIECVGKEFDPEFHNAVMQVESEEYDSGIVAQELQKGYTYKDSVVRHSMVAVVQ